ncbi:MAG: FAD-dependent oxidoreductase [Methanobacteriota archaeon]|nr:MAG: FAD-dependent oxidoreductase [Euryarchaeota archaeon]
MVAHSHDEENALGGHAGRVIVLGAGLAGLSAAYRLKHHHGHDEVIVIEKNSHVGGTASTVTVDGYSFDLTGHALHLGDSMVERFITEDLEMKDELVKVRRKAGILIEDRIVPYPFQYNLGHLTRGLRDKCVIDFLEATYSEGRRSRDSTEQCVSPSFLDYSYSAFGRSITEVFMRPYNRKLWCIDPDDLSTDWMDLVLPKPDLQEILRGAFTVKDHDDTGYNAEFYYPREGGIQHLSEGIGKKIKSLIRLGKEVTDIDMDRKLVKCRDEEYHYDYLVSTIPLKDFMRIARIPCKKGRLSNTITRGFIVVVPSSKAPKYSWIYIPDETKRLYRIGNFSMFSPNISKPGMDVLWLECAVLSDECEELPLFDDILEEMRDCAWLPIEHLKHLATIDIDPSYVVFDRMRNMTLEPVIEECRRKDVIPCGRYGLWSYMSMEQAIKSGFDAADYCMQQ